MHTNHAVAEYFGALSVGHSRVSGDGGGCTGSVLNSRKEGLLLGFFSLSFQRVGPHWRSDPCGFGFRASLFHG